MLRQATVAQQGREHRPDVVQQSRLSEGVGMNTVGLHERGIKSDVLQQEGHQRQFLVARQVAVALAKLFRVLRAVIRRHPYAEQQHLGARRHAQVDHACEIGPISQAWSTWAWRRAPRCCCSEYGCRRITALSTRNNFASATATWRATRNCRWCPSC